VINYDINTAGQGFANDAVIATIGVEDDQPSRWQTIPRPARMKAVMRNSFRTFIFSRMGP